jgi:hypothetical protein
MPPDTAPRRPEEEIHGEQEKKARFGPDSPDFTPSVDSSDPRGADNVAAGKSSDPRGEDSIQSKEAAGGVSSRGAVGGAEAGLSDQLGKGFTGDIAAAALPGNALTKAIPRLISFLRRNKKKAAAGGGIAGIMASLLFIFGIASGPFEFVTLSQSLQLFHFKSNEDFGNNEGAKTLFYAVTGRGAQRARLGIPGNYAADKWEAKLLKETGLKPVYSSTTRLLVGFELANESKAVNNLLDVPEGSKTSRALEEAMGKGAEIVNAGDIAGQDVVSGTGEKLAANARVLNLKDVKSFRERGKFVKTIGKMTNVNDVVSTLASRLLKKRAGVDFHPLKKVYRKTSEKLADWRSERRKEAAKENSDGTKSGKVGAGNTEDTDNDGKPDSASGSDTQAANSADDLIAEAASEPGKSTIKSLLTKTGYGGGIAVGVLCAAKGFGDSVPDYKYTSIVLPMMRMGMMAVTIGNQVMSGEDVSMDELGAFAQSLYDPTSGTHWNDASTIQGEYGYKRTGPGTPPEARLSNVNDKGQFFDILDSIPFLGTACDISNIPGEIPVVKDVINVGSDVVLKGVNLAASAFGTSTDKIMEGALAMVSGQAVDTLAQGADYGNLVNTGAFLAAGQNIISMGGAALSAAQVTELRNFEHANLADENRSKSFAQRYLDPYDATSLRGRLTTEMNPSVHSVAGFFTSSLKLFTGGFSKILPFGSNPVASADSNVDYGVPKFGFSLADQEDPKYENPYDNAVKVERHLSDLNDKYGKKCFGMTVTTSSDGIQIDTEEMGSDDVNIFKVLDKKECLQNSGALSSDTNSSGFWSKLAFWRTDKAEAASGGGRVDPWFNRYRHYLADAVTVATQACWQADGDPEGEKYCSMLGFSDSPDTSTATTETAGATIDMAHLYDPSVSVACDPNTKDLGVQDGYTDGHKVKIRICAVPNLPSSGEESNNGYGVSGAGGSAVVNSRVSGAVFAMVDAAKKDGVNLTAGSSFRTMEHQQALCPCDGVSVAHPGYSNHQMGVAIDFSIDTQSGQFWDWLSNNAADFGYKNYPAEAWHWSPTGH